MQQVAPCGRRGLTLQRPHRRGSRRWAHARQARTPGRGPVLYRLQEGGREGRQSSARNALTRICNSTTPRRAALTGELSGAHAPAAAARQRQRTAHILGSHARELEHGTHCMASAAGAAFSSVRHEAGQGRTRRNGGGGWADLRRRRPRPGARPGRDQGRSCYSSSSRLDSLRGRAYVAKRELCEEGECPAGCLTGNWRSKHASVEAENEYACNATLCGDLKRGQRGHRLGRHPNPCRALSQNQLLTISMPGRGPDALGLLRELGKALR